MGCTNALFMAGVAPEVYNVVTVFLAPTPSVQLLCKDTP
jgi:hypothetical protein